MSKGKRYPHKLRADGELKGLALVSIFGWVDNNYRPTWASATRTRSLRWLTGTRRTKRNMRAAR